MKVLTNIERFGQLNIANATSLSKEGVQSISSKQKKLDQTSWETAKLLRTFTPVIVKKKDPVVAVAVGLAHAVLLFQSGQVSTFGEGNQAQLGVHEKLVHSPDKLVSFPKEKRFQAIAATNTATVVVDTEGAVWTWGTGVYGELGHGGDVDSRDEVTRRASPGRIESLVRSGVKIAKVSGGFNHVVAMADDQETLFAWGRNDFGQLGVRSAETQLNVPSKLRTDWNDEIRTFVAAGHHSCMVTSCGDLWVWGKGGHGQLGLDHNLNQKLPCLNERYSTHTVLDCSATRRYSAVLTESAGLHILGTFAKSRSEGSATRCTKVELPIPSASVTSICCGDTSILVATTTGVLYEVTIRPAIQEPHQKSRYCLPSKAPTTVAVRCVPDLRSHGEAFDVVLDEMLFHVSSTMLVSEKKMQESAVKGPFAHVQSTRKPPRPLFDGRGNRVYPKMFSGLSSPVFLDTEPDRAETPGERARRLLTEKQPFAVMKNSRARIGSKPLTKDEIEEKRLREKETEHGNSVSSDIVYDLKARGRRLEDDNFVLEAKRTFYSIDTDRSKGIDLEELRQGMRLLGFRVSKEGARRLMDYIDLNNDGIIGEDEFLAFAYSREESLRQMNIFWRLLSWLRRKVIPRVSELGYLYFVETFMSECVKRGVWKTLPKAARKKMCLPVKQRYFKFGKVDFSGCSLTDTHVEALCVALKVVPVIKRIKLKGNRISGDGGEQLLELMKWHDEMADYRECAICLICNRPIAFEDHLELEAARGESCPCFPASRGGHYYRLPVHFLQEVDIQDPISYEQRLMSYKVKLNRELRAYLKKCLHDGLLDINRDAPRETQIRQHMRVLGQETGTPITYKEFKRDFFSIISNTADEFEEVCLKGITKATRGKEIRRVFLEADADESGSLELQEIQKCFKLLGLRVSQKQAHRYFRELDKDGNGSVSLEEFEQFMKSSDAMDRLIVLGKKSKKWSKTKSKRILEVKRNGSISVSAIKLDQEPLEKALQAFKEELQTYGEAQLDSRFKKEYFDHTALKLKTLTLGLKRQFYWSVRKQFHKAAPFSEQEGFQRFIHRHKEIACTELLKCFSWTAPENGISQAKDEISELADRLCEYYRVLNAKIQVCSVAATGRFSLIVTVSGDVWMRGIIDGRSRDSHDLWKNKLAQGVRSLEMLSRSTKHQSEQSPPLLSSPE